MPSLAITSSAGVFRKPTARDAALLLALAWFIPFAVHLAPWSGARPLGVYLLPMFWATFVAVYFHGAAAGLLTGLFAPAVNLAVTGLPAWKFVGPASLELVGFALATTWAVRRTPRLWLLAPLGYLVAKAGAALLLAPMNVVGDAGAPARFFSHAVVTGAAGLIVLALINAALVRCFPKTATSADTAK
jgi:hypothetical protein